MLAVVLSLFLALSSPLSYLPGIGGPLRSLVRITTAEFTCTGFVVDAARGRVLTAAHCIDQENPMFVDGEPSEVLKVDEELGMVSIKPMSKPPLDLGGLPKVGEAVVAYGYGYAWETPQVMQRHVANYDTKGYSGFKGGVVLDGAIAPGMSGGPTVDMNGRVVGVNQASNNVLSVVTNANAMLRFIR